MAVGIAPIAVYAATGAVQALDDACRLKRFKVLVHRGVPNAAAPQIELFKDGSSTEVTFFTPEQVEHHASLAAQAHPKPPALLKHLLQGARRGQRADLGGVCSYHKRCLLHQP